MPDSMENDEHDSSAAASPATDEGEIGSHYLDSRQLSIGGILAAVFADINQILQPENPGQLLALDGV